MKKLLLVSVLALVIVAGAFGDLNRSAVQEAIAPHSDGGTTGFCSIAYYNLCSGWFWLWSGWIPGSMIGVVFDLPNDCGMLPGELCSNTHFWWYWRYTLPNYGYTLSYDLYEVDAQMCPTYSVGSVANLDPVERWNFFYGLGTVTGSYAAIIATFAGGPLPYLCTEHNFRNMNTPEACPGFVPDAGHSYMWGCVDPIYCPPYHMAHDSHSDIIMDAGFECHAGTSTENTSWGGVKSLFR